MSARLTIIISQSSVRAGMAADLEETMVAELMMTPGFDATMIGPLESVEKDGTDFLCLSSFNHSLVLLTWLPLEQAQQNWERLGLDGQVIPIGDEAPAGQATSSPARKVFYIQMTESMDAKVALRQLAELLASRQVKTVGINLAPPPRPEKKTQVEAAARSEPKIANIEPVKNGSTGVPSPVQESTADSRPKIVVQDQSSSREELEDQEWEHLDKLVDDFESLDL